MPPTRPTPSFGTGDSTSVVLGDLDGDNDLDAVVANNSNQAETVWLNDGSGVFSSHPTTPSFGAGNSTSVVLGDLDRDGNLDAIVGNYSGQAETVWLNRPANILVTPTSGLTTSESGNTAAFTVVLTDQPTADVTIDLASSNTSEGTVAPASLTFTTTNWNTPQTVTITGVDDTLDDGNIAYTIVTSVPTTTDPAFVMINPADINISNSDDDTAGFTVTPMNGLTTTEAGGMATFTVTMNSQPTADVTIDLISSNTSEGTVAPASLIFTIANWNIPQTVTVTGVNDQFDDGNIAYIIVTMAASSADTNYSGINPADVSISNSDNDYGIYLPLISR